MQAYGKTFAKVYNARWGAFTDALAPKIESLFAACRTELGLSRTLVDLCCGTGNLAAYLLEKGYAVQGIDLSPSMIEYAVQRNRAHVESGRASFAVGDVASTTLIRKVSYATCLYDAINHLPSTEAIDSCIRGTFASLDAKGVFLFDINTAHALRRWNNFSVQEDDDIYISTRGVFDPSMDRAYTQISGFIRIEDGQYERFSETVYNLVLSVRDLLSSVKNAGFASVHCASAEDLSVPVEDPESLRRAFFVCKKE